jgi:hypothetical protein
VQCTQQPCHPPASTFVAVHLPQPPACAACPCVACAVCISVQTATWPIRQPLLSLRFPISQPTCMRCLSTRGMACTTYQWPCTLSLLDVQIDTIYKELYMPALPCTAMHCLDPPAFAACPGVAWHAQLANAWATHISHCYMPVQIVNIGRLIPAYTALHLTHWYTRAHGRFNVQCASVRSHQPCPSASRCFRCNLQSAQPTCMCCLSTCCMACTTYQCIGHAHCHCYMPAQIDTIYEEQSVPALPCTLDPPASSLPVHVWHATATMPRVTHAANMQCQCAVHVSEQPPI